MIGLLKQCGKILLHGKLKFFQDIALAVRDGNDPIVRLVCGFCSPCAPWTSAYRKFNILVPLTRLPCNGKCFIGSSVDLQEYPNL